MMERNQLEAWHRQGLDWEAYLETGTAEQQADWRRVYEQVALESSQAELLAGFSRRMQVIVLTGIWCGDCVQQVPLLQRIAEGAGDRIDMVYLDRDLHADLQDRVMINGGRRVPVVLFAAEDFEFAGWYGDRTLSRYRRMAAEKLGAHCPLPGAEVDEDERKGVLADWLDEFERVQLLLRLSTRLREKHGD